MQNIFNLIKTNKRLALVLIILIVGFIGYVLFSSNPTGFRISHTEPKLGDVATLTSFIRVEFSEPIVKDSVKIPQQDSVRRFEISDKTIKFFLDNVDKDKKQTITIESVTSQTTGKQLTNQKLSYKPKDVPWSKIPREQQAAVLEEQDNNKPATMSDPVMQYMPYNTLNYKLSAVIDNNTVKLHAKLTPSNADTDGTTVNPVAIEQYKKEVLAYLQSINIDPVKYGLTYSVVNPKTLKEE
jgi:hypothetical protein